MWLNRSIIADFLLVRFVSDGLIQTDLHTFECRDHKARVVELVEL